jgi:hypothetical protein
MFLRHFCTKTVALIKTSGFAVHDAYNNQTDILSVLVQLTCFSWGSQHVYAMQELVTLSTILQTYVKDLGHLYYIITPYYATYIMGYKLKMAVFARLKGGIVDSNRNACMFVCAFILCLCCSVCR